MGMAMRKTLLLASLVLVVTLQGVSAPAASSAEPVPRGATQAQVQETLGQPRGQFTAGDVTEWYYENGQVEFKNGRVVRVQWREIARPQDGGMTNLSAMTAVTVAGPSHAIEKTAGTADSQTRKISRLTNQLSKGKVNARREAAGKLESLADPRTWNALVKALEDTDGGVRCGALDALYRIDHQRGFDLVASIALEHRDKTFRYAAIYRLCRMHDPRVVALLILALGDPAPQNSNAAAQGLTGFREAAFQQLRAAIQDSEPGMRRNAAMGLGYFGNAAEAPLLDAVRDPDTSVRIAVVAALGKVKSDRSRDALRLLLSDKEASVRYAAENTQKAVEAIMKIEKLKEDEKLREMGKRQIAKARERRGKQRHLAILCLSGLLALLLVFRVQVLSEPPPLNLLSRILCLASGLSLCVAVIMLLVYFYPSSLSGAHVDAWILIFIWCLGTSFTVMKNLRAAWSWADEALAGKTPRDAYSHLSVDGFLFLALAMCLGIVGYRHMLDREFHMLMLTAALVLPCLIRSAVNLSQRSRVSPTVQRLLQQGASPADIPERPTGVALFSILAMGIGLLMTADGYWLITCDIPCLFVTNRPSNSEGMALIFGIFFLAVGLTSVIAGRSAYLLQESGRRLLVAFYALFCVSGVMRVNPLIWLARDALDSVASLLLMMLGMAALMIAALIYLNLPSVKKVFYSRYDVEDPDDVQRLQNQHWRWLMRLCRR
jgi:HEAT repeat protein